MSPKIKITDLDDLLEQHATKALGDQSLPDDDLVGASTDLEESYSPTSDPDKKDPKNDKKVELTIKTAANVEMRVFNNEADVDPDGILASSDRRERVRERKVNQPLDVPPQVELVKNKAWMKYGFDAQLKGKGGVDINSDSVGFGFKIQNASRLRLADYRVHDPKDPLLPAAVSDLADPRVIFLWSDVRDLGIGDALAVRVEGELSASVSVSWSDVFSSQIGALADLVPGSSVVGLTFEAGAAISASVKLNDEFRLVISRPDANRHRVAVKKVRSSQAKASLSASIDIGFDDAAELTEGVNAAIAGVLGEATSTVERVLKKASLSSLDGPEKELVARVLERFGLDEGDDPLVRFKDLVEERREKIEEVVKEAITAKFKAGFTYEYARTATNESLLQATLPSTKLAELHGDLVRGRLDALLADARTPGSSVELETYLRKKSVKVERAYGFTLGLGSWSAFGKDVDSFAWTEEENRQGEIRRAYEGTHAYRGKWIKENFEWSVDLDVSMDAFATPPVTFDVYNVRLHQLWRMKRSRLSAARLRDYVDMAVAWRIIDQAESSAVIEELDAARGKTTEFVLQIVTGAPELAAILRIIGEHTRVDLAAAMATAMPFRDTHGRERASTRRRLYKPIWKGVLKDDSPSPKGFAAATKDYLRERDYNDLASYESNWSGANRPFTVAGLIYLNKGSLRRDINSFFEGTKSLWDAIRERAVDNGLMKDIFERFSKGWIQSHYARAMGVYITDAAAAAGVIGEVERTLKVSYGNEERVYGA